ncbi:FadR/GntR family transcriptional regulator [Fredinandcohnia humi]
MSSSSSKVYIEIVNQIRSIIHDDGLVAGDKIPSERELSDRLKVGRSSVREALRSLELLGLIETRRGEGTFLKNFEDHQLIHLLGTFIIQGEKTKEDLVETKYLIEKTCIELACNNMDDSVLLELKQGIKDAEDQEEFLFRTIIEATNNRLLLRIWLIVNEYVKLICGERSFITKPEYYDELVTGLLNRSASEAIRAYENMTK